MEKLEIKLGRDQITGFSYSFSKSLLNRLEKSFTDGTLYSKNEWGAPIELSTLTMNLCHYLAEQIPYVGWNGMDINLVSNFAESNFSREEWERCGPSLLKTYNKKVRKIIDEGFSFIKTFEEVFEK
ncbi:MAG: hypothetical protein WCI93_00850 [bacterium]